MNQENKIKIEEEQQIVNSQDINNNDSNQYSQNKDFSQNQLKYEDNDNSIDEFQFDQRLKTPNFSYTSSSAVSSEHQQQEQNYSGQYNYQQQQQNYHNMVIENNNQKNQQQQLQQEEQKKIPKVRKKYPQKPQILQKPEDKVQHLIQLQQEGLDLNDCPYLEKQNVKFKHSKDQILRQLFVLMKIDAHKGYQHYYQNLKNMLTPEVYSKISKRTLHRYIANGRKLLQHETDIEKILISLKLSAGKRRSKLTRDQVISITKQLKERYSDKKFQSKQLARLIRELEPDAEDLISSPKLLRRYFPTFMNCNKNKEKYKQKIDTIDESLVLFPKKNKVEENNIMNTVDQKSSLDTNNINEHDKNRKDPYAVPEYLNYPTSSNHFQQNINAQQQEGLKFKQQNLPDWNQTPQNIPSQNFRFPKPIYGHSNSNSNTNNNNYNSNKPFISIPFLNNNNKLNAPQNIQEEQKGRKIYEQCKQANLLSLEQTDTLEKLNFIRQMKKNQKEFDKNSKILHDLYKEETQTNLTLEKQQNVREKYKNIPKIVRQISQQQEYDKNYHQNYIRQQEENNIIKSSIKPASSSQSLFNLKQLRSPKFIELQREQLYQQKQQQVEQQQYQHSQHQSLQQQQNTENQQRQQQQIQKKAYKNSNQLLDIKSSEQKQTQQGKQQDPVIKQENIEQNDNLVQT